METEPTAFAAQRPAGLIQFLLRFAKVNLIGQSGSLGDNNDLLTANFHESTIHNDRMIEIARVLKL